MWRRGPILLEDSSFSPEGKQLQRSLRKAKTWVDGKQRWLLIHYWFIWLVSAGIMTTIIIIIMNTVNLMYCSLYYLQSDKGNRWDWWLLILISACRMTQILRHPALGVDRTPQVGKTEQSATLQHHKMLRVFLKTQNIMSKMLLSEENSPPEVWTLDRSLMMMMMYQYQSIFLHGSLLFWNISDELVVLSSRWCKEAVGPG